MPVLSLPKGPVMTELGVSGRSWADRAKPARLWSGVEAEVQEFGDRAVPAFVGAVVLMVVAALAGGGFGGAGGGGWAGGSFLARLLRA